MEIRTLRANEIEVRAAQISKSGASLVLYIDARTDMNILDEVYGPGYWQREHQMIGDSLYCIIKVWNNDIKQWVCKSDVGTENNSEKEKSRSSDSFKRTCCNIGIGRELYTVPRIWVSSQYVDIKLNEKGKYITYDTFKVKEVEYNDYREISKLVIVNQDNKVVHTYETKTPIAKDTMNKINLLAECFSKELGNKTAAEVIEVTKKTFNFKKVEDLTNEQGLIVVTHLNNWIELQKKKQNNTEVR